MKKPLMGKDLAAFLFPLVVQDRPDMTTYKGAFL
jgi:hypothetical protein